MRGKSQYHRIAVLNIRVLSFLLSFLFPVSIIESRFLIYASSLFSSLFFSLIIFVFIIFYDYFSEQKTYQQASCLYSGL